MVFQSMTYCVPIYDTLRYQLIISGLLQKLYETLLEDLTKQLYVESTWDVLRMKRPPGGSFEDGGLRRSGSDRGSGRGGTRNSGRGGSGRGTRNNRSTVVPRGGRSTRQFLDLPSSAAGGQQTMRLVQQSDEDFQVRPWFYIIGILGRLYFVGHFCSYESIKSI